MSPTQPQSGNQTKAGEAALREMESHIDELPLLPQVLVRILQLDASGEDYFERFEEMATEDPAFAVRIVALANSASSAPVSPIDTIKGALARLGAGTVANFFASLSVQRVFVPREPSQIKLWQHSIETAVASQYIAQAANTLNIDPDQAYLAGLLHDIGRFVMFEHAAPELREVEERAWETPDELVDAEMDVYQYTHSELGYLACMRWGLPDSIAATVRAHHDPFPEVPTAGSQAAQVFCVALADRISIACLQHAGTTDLSDAKLEALINDQCLRSKHARELLPAATLCDQLPAIKEESARLFANLGLN